MENEYEIPSANRQLSKGLLWLVALVLLSGLAGITYYKTQVSRPATSESHPVTFTVAKGMTTRQIAAALETQNLISSKNVFWLYSVIHHVGSDFQAGQYALDSKMTMAEIIATLTHGKVQSDNRNITIIEGWNNQQIGKYLASQNITTADSDFEKTLSAEDWNFKFKTISSKYNYQGYLFPDTYTLAKDKGVEDLINKMLKDFESKISDKMLADIQSSGRNLHDVMIVASIVEKEVGRNKTNLTQDDLNTMQQERKMVAAIFYNRLRIGMALESDATVNYITGKTTRSVSLDDTKIKSAYNTYLNRGLPPSPISNPGLNSIMAAIYPAQTNDLYFLNAPDGTAYFAATLAEHNANKAKYLK